MKTESKISDDESAWWSPLRATQKTFPRGSYFTAVSAAAQRTVSATPKSALYFHIYSYTHTHPIHDAWMVHVSFALCCHCHIR